MNETWKQAMTVELLKEGGAKLTIAGESQFFPNIVDLHMSKARGQSGELLMIVKVTTSDEQPEALNPNKPTMVSSLHTVEWVLPLVKKPEMPVGASVSVDPEAEKQFEETPKVVEEVFENPGIE